MHACLEVPALKSQQAPSTSEPGSLAKVHLLANVLDDTKICFGTLKASARPSRSRVRLGTLPAFRVTAHVTGGAG